MALEINMQLIGHVGQDADVKQISERFVVNFSVAATEKWGAAENQQRTTWVRCAYWFSKQPNIQDYLKKGQLVAVQGSPSASAYTDQGGNAVGKLELTVGGLKLLGNTQAQQQAPAQSTPTQTSTTPEEDDDLPF